MQQRMLRKGRVLDDRYRVENMVARGAFGSVYLATDRRLDVPVAIKVLNPQHSGTTPEDLARFRLEMRIQSALQSPYVARVSDWGSVEGSPYLVAEWIEGASVAARVQAGGLPSETQTARICADVLRGLAAAHAAGVVHRDVKPANIMLSDTRNAALLVDFGIAKVVGGSFGAEVHTRVGVVCTAAYVAPEVLRRAPTFASDLYSLGHVMCELLDGEVPYNGDDPESVLRGHLSALPVPLGEGVRASRLHAVVARAVEKRVERRFADATEMLAALVDAVPEVKDELVPPAEGWFVFDEAELAPTERYATYSVTKRLAAAPAHVGPE